MIRRGWSLCAHALLAVVVAGCATDTAPGGATSGDAVGQVDGLAGDDGAAVDASGALADAGADTTPEDVVAPIDGALTPDVGAADAGPSDAGPSDAGPGDTGAGTYHPAGWAKASNHGMAAKMGDQDCRTCHGADLTGAGPISSCDSCHQPGWRTNCTFCHGGTDNDTGAPPQGIDDLDAPLTFPAHSKHVEETIHGAYDCSQCHKKPTDVLSEGHLFDATPGQTEIDFSGGLNKAGTYDAGTCSNLYCHGNGRTDKGTSNVDDGPKTCTSCHPNGATGVTAMSGKHALHVFEGVSCWECHQSVLGSNGQILDPTLHVNGEKNPKLPAGISYTGGSCSGSCHGKNHNSKKW